MKVNWEEVPWWLNWVTIDVHPSNRADYQPRAIGWSAKPKIEIDGIGEKYWDNWFCSEDDGFSCELPMYVADWEEGDTIESAIAERPKK